MTHFDITSLYMISYSFLSLLYFSIGIYHFHCHKTFVLKMMCFVVSILGSHRVCHHLMGTSSWRVLHWCFSLHKWHFPKIFTCSWTNSGFSPCSSSKLVINSQILIFHESYSFFLARFRYTFFFTIFLLISPHNTFCHTKCANFLLSPWCTDSNSSTSWKLYLSPPPEVSPHTSTIIPPFHLNHNGISPTLP